MIAVVHRTLALIFAGVLFLPAPPAASQSAIDRDTYARNYVQFLVEQSDQWTKEFPQAFSQALITLPANSTLDEQSKAAAGELRTAIEKLLPLSSTADVVTNTEFRMQLERTLAFGKLVNQVFASQKLAEGLRTDWVQIRSTLNGLARIYRMNSLDPLGPPPGAPKSETVAAAPPSGKGIIGYVVDQQCAKRGKAMWVNVACIQRCIREGDKAVIVTEEGKIYQIANPEKIDAETYGQKLTVLGEITGDTITVASLR